MRESRLEELGIKLAEKVAPVGSYVPVSIVGNLVFVSGQLPLEGGELRYKGKVGEDLTVEQGYDAAKLAALNGLSVINHALGSLLGLNRIVKITGYVASAPGFSEQHKVVDGASEFFFELLSENGKHSRVAVGVSELPLNSPVEIEIVAEISPDYGF